MKVTTVKDAFKLLRPTDDIKLAWNGLLFDFDPQNGLDVAAYGDFAIEGIRANGEDSFELDLLAEPVRVCRDRVKLRRVGH